MNFFQPAWHLLRFLLASVVSFLIAPRAPGHEPFDISTRITIYPDRLELISTLGSDGMRELLSAGGLSEHQIAESLKARGPEVPAKYPSTLAPLFFLVINRGEPLVAKSFTSVSEGVEIIVKLIFPRPAAGTLEVRAVGYKTIPKLQKGVLIVEDEAGKSLDAAMLSSQRMELLVEVPATRPAPANSTPP